jgi:glycosyltransferase involved in cell wall biosynthesis
MRVSVITPVYNGAKYLGPAIDSLLAQTMQDWELIIVDDGSTDETPQVIERCTDPRIVKVRQPNAGEAVARNTGLQRARGDYIGWLDADDLYLPNALADLAGFLDQHPEFDIVYSDGYVCDENGNTLMRLSEHRPGVPTGNILEQIVLSSLVTAPICALTRRAAIERHSVAFDRNLVIGPDWDFWTQLARHVHFGYLDKLTCMYRVHLSNITRLVGQRKRNNDLVFGRMKVLNADWFEELSVQTQQQFFYRLLVVLLADQPERQREIMHGIKFQRLPASRQAALWRHMARDYVLKGAETAFAVECLRSAQQLAARDVRSRLLLQALQSDAGRRIAAVAVRLWEAARNMANRLRHPGQRRPKAMPEGLRPVGD